MNATILVPKVTESQAYEAIRLAQFHFAPNSSMASSAGASLEDSVELYNDGDYWYATARARDSIGYSVGVFHPAYSEVSAFLGRTS